MSNNNPSSYYNERLKILQSRIKQLNILKRKLAWLRLISFMAAVVALWLLWASSWSVAVLIFLALISIFIYFVSKDQLNSEAIDNTLFLITINENEIKTLDHQYLNQPDGSDWKPVYHPYANDLDIFGRASLYQYFNRTTSEQGNQLMAEWFSEPAGKPVIEKRQEATRELSGLLEWRQQFQAFGMKKRLTIKTEKNIRQWLEEKNMFLDNNFWKVFRMLFPVLSISFFGLYLADYITFSQYLPVILLFLGISFLVSRKINPAYNTLNKITSELETLSDSIDWIEKKSFRSSLLNELSASYSFSDSKVSVTIRQLKKILDRLDYRLNPVVYIPLSALLCWDLQQIFGLEKWKIKNKNQTSHWFAALADTECLSSLGNLSFNHPDWCFPVIIEEEPFLKAEEMGHPLIPANKRVNNSFITKGISQLCLITGSNMAGKSTFLRSTGVNIVLAMMGAPVCAKSFSLSPTKIISTMRVNDNLEENTSTFYAELKKLKEILTAVYENKKVFLLLDEILRGTNSADRHTGSTALLKQLIKHNAVGMVATHDLELANLAKEFPDNIHNYHFDVQVNGEELFFDYKLKKGICKSMNASILMKKIGIEL